MPSPNLPCVRYKDGLQTEGIFTAELTPLDLAMLFSNSLLPLLVLLSVFGAEALPNRQDENLVRDFDFVDSLDGQLLTNRGDDDDDDDTKAHEYHGNLTEVEEGDRIIGGSFARNRQFPHMVSIAR